MKVTELYKNDGSDSEVEYGLVSRKIDLLPLSRQPSEEELSEIEDDETF